MLRGYEQSIDVASFKSKSGYWEAIKKARVPSIVFLCVEARFD